MFQESPDGVRLQVPYMIAMFGFRGPAKSLSPGYARPPAIRLIVDLLIANDAKALTGTGIIRTVYR